MLLKVSPEGLCLMTSMRHIPKIHLVPGILCRRQFELQKFKLKDYVSSTGNFPQGGFSLC